MPFEPTARDYIQSMKMLAMWVDIITYSIP